MQNLSSPYFRSRLVAVRIVGAVPVPSAEFLKHRTGVAVAAVAAATAAVCGLDLLLPLGYAVPMLYALPILLSRMLPDQRSIVLVTGGAILLIWIGAVFSSGEFTLAILTNRTMASLLLLTIGWLLLRIQKQSAQTITTAQQARDASEERLRLAQAAEGFGTFDVDLPSSQVLWSPETERIWGLPVGGFEGTFDDWRRRIHPDDVAEAERVSRLALDTPGRTYDLDYRILCPDGTVRWIHAMATIVRDAAGHPRRMVGVNVDITSRKQAEAALAESEARFRQAVEFAPNGILMVTADGTISMANKQVERLFGYHSSELIGQPLAILIPARVREKHAAEVQRFFAARTPRAMGQERGLFGLRKDGKEILLEIGLVPVDTPEGPQVLASILDITERKQLEAQLRQSTKLAAIGQLAGGVAHDFNNLLTVITGYSDLLLSRAQTDETLRQPAEAIRGASERATTLTRQLLAFSRQQVVQPRVLDLNGVVNHLGQILRRLIGEHIRLVTVLAPNLGFIKADPGQLEQVLINLAVNARDAMARGGTLTIETANVVSPTHGSAVQLLVRDTGHGMDEDMQAHLFEPFFTTKEVGQGTGLGLASVYGIVTQSGGTIRVESQLGCGAAFIIEFPRVEGVVAPVAPVAREAIQPGTETILLVEDDDGVRLYMKTVLTECGYQVLDAASPEAALQLVAQPHPPIQLLITDMVMPGLSGWQLVERIRQQEAALKVLFISGYAGTQLEMSEVAAKAVHFLPKPFTPAKLADTVRTVLESQTARPPEIEQTRTNQP